MLRASRGGDESTAGAQIGGGCMIDDTYVSATIDEASLTTDEEADFLLSLQAAVDAGTISEQDAENEIDCLYGAL